MGVFLFCVYQVGFDTGLFYFCDFTHAHFYLGAIIFFYVLCLFLMLVYF